MDDNGKYPLLSAEVHWTFSGFSCFPPILLSTISFSGISGTHNTMLSYFVIVYVLHDLLSITTQYNDEPFSVRRRHRNFYRYTDVFGYYICCVRFS